MNQSLEDRRRELWIGVCIAVNGTVNCLEYATAPKYANAALAEFDKVFPKDTGNEIPYESRELIMKQTAKAIERDILVVFQGQPTKNIKMDSIISYFDGFLGREPLTMEQKMRDAADKINLDM